MAQEAISLKSAIEIALENNHHIKSALATLPIAEAKLIVAKYRPNFILGANSEIVKGGSLHPVQVGTQLEIGRKRHWRIKLAKEEISKTELEIRKVLWETHTEVHATYAELSVGLKLFDLAKERVAFYKSLLDIAETRFQAGDISKLELERAKTELLRTENQFKDFEGRLKKAKIEFSHILGKEPQSELSLDLVEKLKPKIKLHEHPGMDKVIANALKENLKMAILEKEFGITRAKIKKARWELVPNLYIEAGPVKPSIGDNIWGPYVGGAVEVPVFNRKQGEIKEAKAQLEYLEREKERIEHDIKIEVAKSFHDIEVEEEQIHMFQGELLDQSENILEMTMFGYKNGKLTLTDVLSAEEQNRNINERYLESLLQYQLALASLEYAVGVPLYEFGEKL